MLSLAALLSRGALLPFSDDEESYHNDYTYQGDKLVQARHNTSDNAAEDVTYAFAYDAVNRPAAVRVESSCCPKRLIMPMVRCRR